MALNYRNRLRGFRPKSIPPEDFYRLDLKKTTKENCFEIYSLLCAKDTSQNKKLHLLNGLTTIFQDNANNDSNLGFTTEEFLYCLSTALIHHFTQIRAATLRAIRYLLKTKNDLKIFNALQLPFLVCRSIDILLKCESIKNDDERVQALKLIRKMLSISPEDISPVLVRCLVSLGNGGIEDGDRDKDRCSDRDRLLRACLATLCEFGTLNPTLLIVCGGVGAITRNVLECHSPRIAESLVGVLLYLLEWPHTRNIAGVRLDCLAAPYCDFTYRIGIMDKNKDARELRYTSSRLALLSVLRSWAGIIEFCDPNKPSGLKAIVDVLYLNQLEVRKAILDLLYELIGLPQPIWTDEYCVALAAVDPSDFQDSWLLTNGFVAMEGRSILPSLASSVPNVCEQHMALLLYCFLETGLINALVEVIVTSDTFISVRATVLIGKLLHLMHTHLPADICNTSPALPTLIAHATEGNYQANAAISALQNYHQMLKNRPASCSLFLDSIIQSGTLINSRVFKREINTQYENLNLLLPPLINNVERKRLDSASSSISGGGGGPNDTHASNTYEISSSLPTASTLKRASFRMKRKKITQFFESIREFDRLIKDSNVLTHADSNSWDWEVIIAILKSDSIGKLDDTKCRFLKRLVHYFKPSSNRFSHQDLSHGRNIPSCVIAGLDLIDWLLISSDLECIRLLTDLYSDISHQLLAISTSSRAHDCLFSPQHMSSTMCQMYFLFIGRMCRYEKGLTILTNTAIFKQLMNLVTNTDHVCYVKLIVSGLDYNLDSFSRDILEKALVSAKTRSGRLYATQFLLVLLRAKIQNFEIWGIPMLINQTKDSERSVALAALEIIDESCHNKEYLEELVSLWPNLKSLGDAGTVLMTRYYSVPRGFQNPNSRIHEEIELWKNYYNRRYVLLVEADTHSSLTLHIKNEDGLYSRRSSSSRPSIIPPNVPPHLYGQLMQTELGAKELKEHGNISKYIEILSKAKCSDENESLELKSALWIIGHMSSHSDGIEYLNDPITKVYEKVIKLTKFCDLYSIRATAFYVLGLIASTNQGANILYKLDWFCIRHDRNTMWPVHQPEDWIKTPNVTPIRHQFEPMPPPYNYPGIDEQLNDLNLSSDSNSFLIDDVHDNNSKVMDAKSELLNQTKNPAAKSKTLPESNAARFSKHQRSLSESKTTDVISLITVGGYQQHRTRFNSGTDSNTSGVSSSESVFGRNVIGDIGQMPLSPIPSTSNLLELPSTKKTNFRRISLVGTTLRENLITPQDLHGYSLIRSLRSHYRPMLSESAADDLLEIIDGSELATISKNASRTRKLSIGSLAVGDTQRKLKVRSLDRRSTAQVLLPCLRSEDFQIPLPSLSAPKFLTKNDEKGPCYTGICLPKNILDLFPPRNLNRTYISCDIQDTDLINSVNLLKSNNLNNSVNEPINYTDFSTVINYGIGGGESVVSSLSDVSSSSRKLHTKWLNTRHNRESCLSCSRPMKKNNLHMQPQQTDSVAYSDYNFSTKRNTILTKSNQSSAQLSDISFNSPESILSDENYPDKLTLNVLQHVQRISNPVTSRPAKLSLLELKQTNKGLFQDICLYSEVCKTLGRTSYRMIARRFLQELFLDLNFDTFYMEPNEILLKYNNIKEELLPIQNKINSSIKNDKKVLNSTVQITTNITTNATTTTTIVTTSNPSNYSVLKNHHLKSLPLESVSESSYENIHDTLLNNNKNTRYEYKNYRNLERNSSVTDETKIIENENKKYTRGRFYTLELDLTCTKNKFPITDRNKFIVTTTTPITTTTSTSTLNQLTFTKSLSSSISKPIGSLYCEKRLQTSKSEANIK